MNIRSNVFQAAFLCLVAGGATADDLTLVAKVTEDGKDAGTVTSYLSSDRVRIANPGGSEMIGELATGKFTVIDNKRKEYFVVTKDEMVAAMAQMQANMKQMEAQMQKSQEQMKNMPPALREKMAGLMGGIAASVDVKKTGATRTVAGYRCETWTVSLGEMSVTEQCLTMDLPLPTQAWEAYRGYAEQMKAGMAAGPMGQAMSQMAEKTKDMKGYPLAASTTTKIMGRGSSNGSEVVEVKKGPIPSSAWELPAGYKQTESPMAKMLKKK